MITPPTSRDMYSKEEFQVAFLHQNCRYKIILLHDKFTGSLPLQTFRTHRLGLNNKIIESNKQSCDIKLVARTAGATVARSTPDRKVYVQTFSNVLTSH
jgi:hypothetical protein